MSKTIVPVMLGADLNCYNLARAFHEKYGVKSYAFGRYAIAPTKYSTIIHFTIVPDIDKDEVMLDTLHRFADAHIGDKMLLFGCTDDYAAMIIRNREELSEQIRALKDLKEMAASYGFDISLPARNVKEAIQWLYFGYLAAVKEQKVAVAFLK